jgi:spermidine/putrescine transport system substrate-binding protein
MGYRSVLDAVFSPLSLILALSAPGVMAADYPPPSPKQKLVILNWSEYIDPEVIEAFEQQYNAEVSEIYFESDELRNDTLVESDGAGYDLAMVNGVGLETYRKRGWLAPLDLDKFENYRHIDPHWLNAFPAADGYAVPYFWGTVGIAYRADLVEKPLTSWMDILRPAEALRGKVNMVEDPRDMFTVGLKALGYSLNSTDAGEIRAAESLLLEQRPYVNGYEYISLKDESALLSGELVAALTYNGDALMLRERDEHIAYVLPSEGSAIWVDYLVVLNKSQHKALALAFLNFINEPETAAKLAEYVWYATPNKSAEKLLPEEFLSNPVIYPGTEALAKSEFYKALPPRAARKRNIAFAKVMR